MKPCPFCAEEIAEESPVCPYCRSDLSAPPGGALGPPGRRQTSNATVWIIVSVAVGGGLLLIVPCLIALLLPAVQQAREAARQVQCENNLRRIAMAVQGYRADHGTLPPAYVADEDGTPLHSWRVLILPYLDHQALYESYDFSRPWDSPANRAVLENRPEVFACPSASDPDPTLTHYAGVFGPGCLFEGPKGVAAEGGRGVLLVGEAAGAGIPWTQPQDIDVTRHPALGGKDGFSSEHPRGVHFVSGDGAVELIGNEIDRETFRRRLIRNERGPAQ